MKKQAPHFSARTKVICILPRPRPRAPREPLAKLCVGLPRSIASASNPLHLLPYRPRSPLVVPPRNAGNHRASCRLRSARPCSRRSGATDHRTFNCTLISGSEMTTQQPESRHESAHSLVVCVPRFVAQDRSAMQSACAGWPDDRSGERGVSPKRASSRFESGQFAGVSAGLRAACVVARPNRASENGRKNNREGEQYASWRKLVVCGTRSRNRQKTQHWCGHNSPPARSSLTWLFGCTVVAINVNCDRCHTHTAIQARITASHPNSEVKLALAGVVLWWGTTWEGPVLCVLFALLLFCDLALFVCSVPFATWRALSFAHSRA